MTNKEELQKHIQLLNEIKSRYPILTDTIKYLEEYQQTLSNPTLLECIKEWNEKGFDVDVYAVEIVIYKPSSVDKEEDEIEISIRLDNKIISYVNDVELSFDLHNLIHKTLKALEEMKDG